VSRSLASATDITSRISEFEGELHRDLTHRRLYATDASIYSELPAAVAFPRSAGDVVSLLRGCSATGAAFIPRAAGTSLAGQVVGSGMVVDMGRHLNRIVAFDGAEQRVTVEPGVIQDDLNRYLQERGLLFGPDTSTSSRAMIGGMIGNNSCGSRSIQYGTTREHVSGAQVVLASGESVRFDDWDEARVEREIGAGGAVGRILVGLRGIVNAHRDDIAARFPKAGVTRRNSGYALDYLVKTVLVDPQGAPLNLAKFLCGSEGTLGVVTEATLETVRLPTARRILVPHFATMRAALEAVVRVVPLKPTAVELVDKALLDLTKTQLEQSRNRFFLEGDPEAILIIEMSGDDVDAIDARRAELAASLTDGGGAYACPMIDPDDAERVWSLRKAGLGLLMGLPGDAKPVAFVEDTAVDVADLPEYVDRYAAIMKKHDISCFYYGHASVGELHFRPVLDLAREAQVETMKTMAREVAELVAEFGGSISGEHGDGRVRSPFIETAMGPELVGAFERVKALWDPNGVLNPGKIVNPEPVDAALRDIPHEIPVETGFRFAEQGGLLRALERCNGAGACRKLDGAGGTMCPSYMATRDELHTTRGRANLMRSLLTSEDPTVAMGSEELYGAMELCLQCKGCKSECPASVDLAKLKSEFLQHYWDINGAPLATRAFAFIARLNRLAQLLPRLANWMFRGRTGRLIKRLLGVHPDRALPPLSRISLRRWHRRRAVPRETAPAGSVALFVDEFTNAQDLEVGKAAIQLLEALGYEVLLPKHVDSGRPMLSKGMVRAAAGRARKNVEKLVPLARVGVPIVGLEPSAALTLIDEYPDLVPERLVDDATIVASATRLFEDFLAEAHADRDLSGFFDDTGRTIRLHGHCHQKALVGTAGALACLGIPSGHEVSLIDAGCCGMAGSFGYEAKHHELSLKIGESRLFPAVRDADDETIIAAAGFSCRHQILDGTGTTAVHPAQVLLGALKSSVFSGGGREGAKGAKD